LNYRVAIVRSAEKELDRLPGAIHDRIAKMVLSLEENPRPRAAKKLSGRQEYRIRVGDYRVLYVIDDRDRVVTITAAGHRSHIYG
jgi:mRNA interferase RelE/StbE